MLTRGKDGGGEGGGEGGGGVGGGGGGWQDDLCTGSAGVERTMGQ